MRLEILSQFLDVPTSHGLVGRLDTLATHDFCPWVNRYVYWLKEPVGWFVVALAISVLVGAFLSPLGWTVAAGLCAILILGLGFPWLAVRMIHCELRPVNSELYERDASQLELTVRNRLPLPIMGLMVEGYLSQSGLSSHDAFEPAVPDVALTRVPALSTAVYRLSIQPEYRGCYPVQRPSVACAFPLGIWTARRPIGKVVPVTVWPLLIPITSELEFPGSRLAEVGTGQRASSQGEFLGVREFRRGDSLKSIHWVQSARNDRLIVCERGGPQQQAVELHLWTASSRGSLADRRENLAWRVRIVASLVDLLVSRHLPFHLLIDGKRTRLPNGEAARRFAWDRLAAIPLDQPLATGGNPSAKCEVNSKAAFSTSRILIGAELDNGQPLPAQLVRCEVKFATSGLRSHALESTGLLDLDKDIPEQLDHLLMEASHASHVA